MQVTILFFGRIAELTGQSSLQLQEVSDTASAIQLLQTKYPALSNARYAIAVDKKVVQENTLLQHQSTLALLPPFSGG